MLFFGSILRWAGGKAAASERSEAAEGLEQGGKAADRAGAACEGPSKPASCAMARPKAVGRRGSPKTFYSGIG